MYLCTLHMQSMDRRAHELMSSLKGVSMVDYADVCMPWPRSGLIVSFSRSEPLDLFPAL